MSADLHCHTKISDGSTAIDELVILAKNKGIDTISVTDHDTFGGVKRAKVFGDKFGVKIIPGVEISAFDNDRKRKVHLLCYLPKSSDRLVGILRRTNYNRKKAMSISIQKVLRAYPIPYDMILRRTAGSTSIYKQHIMQALMDAGYTDEMFGDVFRKLFDTRFGLAKSSFEYPDVFEVLRLIRESGGISVLAHPAVYDSYDLMYELIEKGLNGIEVWYPRAADNDEKLLTEVAQKYNLIRTGGTDFHGVNTSAVNPIGTAVTPDDELEKLLNLARKIHSA